jgi:hypothetical protein
VTKEILITRSESTTDLTQRVLQDSPKATNNIATAQTFTSAYPSAGKANGVPNGGRKTELNGKTPVNGKLDAVVKKKEDGGVVDSINMGIGGAEEVFACMVV